MDINETILSLVKAQSTLLLSLAERQTMMHCALEAFVRQEAQDFDSYTALRSQLFQDEFYGEMNALLQILRTALDHADTAPSSSLPSSTMPNHGVQPTIGMAADASRSASTVLREPSSEMDTIRRMAV